MKNINLIYIYFNLCAIISFIIIITNNYSDANLIYTCVVSGNIIMLIDGIMNIYIDKIKNKESENNA